jgi:hypothetical protein
MPMDKAERIERKGAGMPRDNAVGRAWEDGTDWNTRGQRMDGGMSPCRTDRVWQCSSLILSKENRVPERLRSISRQCLCAALLSPTHIDASKWTGGHNGEGSNRRNAYSHP